MLFSSISFLYYYLPIVVLVYFAVPQSMKNGILLVASLIFYAWGEPKYVILMLVSIIASYLAGLMIETFQNTRWKRVCLISYIAVCLDVLGYFKYADFFIENFAAVTGLHISTLKVVLPIGISFYTFQVISYVVDVYRGEVNAQKDFIKLATYIAMFPQLIAGPIVRYTDIAVELETRGHTVEKFALGCRRFIIGLSKKVLLANVLGELCALFRASDEKSILFYWLYAVATCLQIYFDFSGYSDMAIGLGKIFGFTFLENFNYPYISKSITEFWRRWHISLSSWFRDYVYIPLGGNRVTKIRWYFNISFVWLLTGLWHGAGWNFILWGIIFAFFLILEKICLLDWLKKAKIWNHIYVLFVILITFVIFNATNMKEAATYLGEMFGCGNLPVSSPEFLYYLKSYGVVLIVAIIGATPCLKSIICRCSENKCLQKMIDLAEPIVLLLLLLLSTAYLVDGSFNPFLYFRF